MLGVKVAYREFNDLPTTKINEMRSTRRYHVIVNMEHAAKKAYLRSLKSRTLCTHQGPGFVSLLIHDSVTESELEDMYTLFQDCLSTSEGSLVVTSTSFQHIFDKVRCAVHCAAFAHAEPNYRSCTGGRGVPI